MENAVEEIEKELEKAKTVREKIRVLMEIALPEKEAKTIDKKEE